jgi:ribose/xylose/arabinose/galactoside ABC-type transport system permease subunit
MSAADVTAARRPSVGAPPAIRRWLLRPETPALVFLVGLLAFLGAAVEGFLTPGNLQSILLQISTTAIIALGVNQVILAGEIDISMGSLLGLAAVGVGTVAVATGSFWLALLTGLAIGSAVGWINGALVTKGGTPAIIVTLGMLYALRGAILLVTGGRSVSGIPFETRVLGRGSLLGIGYPVILLAVLFLLLAAFTRHTTVGRDVLAVGSNRQAARLAGLTIDRTRWLTFVLNGAFVGLAAVVYVGRTAGVQPSAGSGVELEAIAAVVLGGTSIAGGYGSNLSPILGAVLIGMINNAMVLQRIPAVWQSAVLGALILLAVSVDGIRRRFARGAA